MKKFLIRNEGEFNFNYLQLGNKSLTTWKIFSEGLIEAFRNCFENKVQIINHNLEIIKKEVYKKAGSLPTISIDPCIPGDINFGVSHIYSSYGKRSVKLSSRPGFPSLDKQIAKIPAGDYMLIEDDIFSGSTIKYIIDILSRKRVNIKSVIVSIQVNGSTKVKVPIKSVYFYQDEEIVDLNNPRDVFAGGYEGGLVMQNNNVNTDRNDINFRVPCLLPFAEMTTRLSIPKKKTLSFSRKVWELNKEFWKLFPQVKIIDVDKYFASMALAIGFKPSDSMFSFCNSVHGALCLPGQTFFKKGSMVLDLDFRRRV